MGGWSPPTARACLSCPCACLPYMLLRFEEALWPNPRLASLQGWHTCLPTHQPPRYTLPQPLSSSLLPHHTSASFVTLGYLSIIHSGASCSSCCLFLMASRGHLLGMAIHWPGYCPCPLLCASSCCFSSH